MFLQILMVILFILIMIIFYLIFKPLNIYLTFKNNNLDYSGVLYITHCFLEVVLNLNERTLFINFKLNDRKFIIKSINLDNKNTINNKDNECTLDNKNNSDYENNNDNIMNILSDIVYLIKNSYMDIFELLKLLTQTCLFKNSYAMINLGLKDNNLTIKLCNIIWALSAPFYPLGFHIILTPEINKHVLKSDINLSFNIIIVNILKIILKIIKTKNLRNFFIKIIKRLM